MILPYQVDVPMERLPIANWLLIGFTCLCFLMMVFADVPLSVGDLGVWQPIVCLFIHGGLGHLLGNMLFLFVFGNSVNAKLGHVWFLAAYLLLGVVEGTVWLLFGPGVPAIGASGAIMGIVGMFLVLFPRNDVRVFYLLALAGVGVIYISSGWLVLFYMGCDLLGLVVIGNRGGVAYLCHLVGACSGIILAGVLLAAGWIRSTAYEENLLQVLGWQEKEQRKSAGGPSRRHVYRIR